MNSLRIQRTPVWVLLIAVMAFGVTGWANVARGEAPGKKGPVAKPVSATQPASPKTTSQAIEAAHNAGAYLLVVFYDRNDALHADMVKAVTAFKAKAAEKIRIFQADVKAPAESQIVAKYGIGRAKLPLLLIFAPNGAITGGFEQKVTPERLGKALVSELVADIIKGVREQKVVVVALENGKTKYNAQADGAARDLANDPKLKGRVEILRGDPENPRNLEFLGQCDIKKPVSTATLVLLAPPGGTIMGVFPGDQVTKDTLLDALTPKSSGCCPGGGSCK